MNRFHIKRSSYRNHIRDCFQTAFQHHLRKLYHNSVSARDINIYTLCLYLHIVEKTLSMLSKINHTHSHQVSCAAVAARASAACARRSSSAPPSARAAPSGAVAVAAASCDAGDPPRARTGPQRRPWRQRQRLAGCPYWRHEEERGHQRGSQRRLNWSLSTGGGFAGIEMSRFGRSSWTCWLLLLLLLLMLFLLLLQLLLLLLSLFWLMLRHLQPL